MAAALAARGETASTRSSGAYTRALCACSQAAEAALKATLDCPGVPGSTQDALAPKLKQVKRRLADIAKMPDPNAISFTSSDEEDYESSPGSTRAASPAPSPAASREPPAVTLNLMATAAVAEGKPKKMTWKEKQVEAKRRKAENAAGGGAAAAAVAVTLDAAPGAYSVRLVTPLCLLCHGPDRRLCLYI